MLFWRKPISLDSGACIQSTQSNEKQAWNKFHEFSNLFRFWSKNVEIPFSDRIYNANATISKIPKFIERILINWTIWFIFVCVWIHSEEYSSRWSVIFLFGFLCKNIQQFSKRISGMHVASCQFTHIWCNFHSYKFYKRYTNVYV